MNKKILAALKPGGIYLVIDHNAEDGSGWRDASTLHRIDPATIKSEVTAAGFELVQDSPLLANPADDRKQSMRADRHPRQNGSGRARVPQAGEIAGVAKLVRPFAALRPTAASAAEVVAPPYDVVSTEEARALAAGRPRSFLHISRPEIDLPRRQLAVLRRGLRARRARISSGSSRSGVLVRDARAVVLHLSDGHERPRADRRRVRGLGRAPTSRTASAATSSRGPTRRTIACATSRR